MITDKITHLITRKNVFAILSIVAIVAVSAILYTIGKKKLASEVADKTIKTLQASGEIDGKDIIAMAQVREVLIKFYYSKNSLSTLYKMSKYSEAEIMQIVKGAA